MRKSLASIAALAALAASGVSTLPTTSNVPTASQASQTQVQKAANVPTKAAKRATPLIATGYGVETRGKDRRRGPGWTQAHVQRLARKKRNQARHRKACRG
jgi:hypothetical protein